VTKLITTIGMLVGATAYAAGGTTLNGSGSTFQKAFQETAIELFKKAHPNVTINYGGGGSGKGRQDLADLVVDFAGSDSPYKEADLARTRRRGAVLPVLLGPITLSYNVDVSIGCSYPPRRAKSSSATSRSGTTRPSPPTTRRSSCRPPTSSSRTAPTARARTDNFTRYLDAATKTTWRLKSGSTVEWPRDTQAGRQLGRRADREVDQGRHRLRRPVDAKARACATPASRTWPASSSSRPPRAPPPRPTAST